MAAPCRRGEGGVLSEHRSKCSRLQKVSELQQVPLVFLWSFGCLCAFVSVGLSVILQGFTTEDLKEGSRNHHVVLG